MTKKKSKKRLTRQLRNQRFWRIFFSIIVALILMLSLFPQHSLFMTHADTARIQEVGFAAWFGTWSHWRVALTSALVYLGVVLVLYLLYGVGNRHFHGSLRYLIYAFFIMLLSIGVFSPVLNRGRGMPAMVSTYYQEHGYLRWFFSWNHWSGVLLACVFVASFIALVKLIIYLVWKYGKKQ